MRICEHSAKNAMDIDDLSEHENASGNGSLMLLLCHSLPAYRPIADMMFSLSKVGVRAVPSGLLRRIY